MPRAKADEDEEVPAEAVEEEAPALDLFPQTALNLGIDPAVGTAIEEALGDGERDQAAVAQAAMDAGLNRDRAEQFAAKVSDKA